MHLSTTAMHPGFADPVLWLPDPFTHSHPGFAVTTIEYKLSNFTISQERGVQMSTQPLQLAAG